MTAVDLTHAVEPELRHAGDFLASLPSERASWAGLLVPWCASRGLTEAETAAVRVAVFHLRMRAATERAARRRR